jgi:hypothetical protein
MPVLPVRWVLERGADAAPCTGSGRPGTIGSAFSLAVIKSRDNRDCKEKSLCPASILLQLTELNLPVR